MSKNRVYGEDVLVSLWNQDRTTPLIVDFDEIRDEAQVQNKLYKGISKRVHQNQSYNSGYALTLTRSKRDNYLTTLIDFNNWCIQRGLIPPKFAIEVVVTYTYSVNNIDPNKEFDGAYKDLFNSFNKFTDTIKDVKAEYNKYIGQAQAIAGKIATPDQLKALYGVNSVANNVNNLINKSLGGFETLKGIYEATLPPFTERYVYYNCGIKANSSGHKPKENSVETIEFNSSYRVNMSDKNQYTDNHANKLWFNLITNMIQDTTAKDKGNQTILNNINLNKNYSQLLQQHLDDLKGLRDG